MSAFTQLMPLLEQCESLVMIITRQGDKLSVVTQPKAKADAPEGLRNQIHLVGTAAELDMEFANAILGHAEQVKSVSEQIAENKALMDAEKKRLADTAKSKKPLIKPSKAAATSEDDYSGDSETSGNSEDPQTSDESDSNSPTQTNAPVEIELF